MAENTVYFLLYNGTAWNLVGSSAAGDVSASAVLADNALIRGDGGAKGVQDSGILIDDSDNMSGVGTLDTTGDVTIAASTTEVKVAAIGTGRSGNGDSILRLVGDSTYSIYGMRCKRHAGANGQSEISHRGLGQLRIKAIDAGPIELHTTNLKRFEIASTGEMLLVEMAAPSTPASGELAIYADSTTSLPMAKNDAGTAFDLTSYALNPIADATTTRTLADTDKGADIYCSNAGAITISLNTGLTAGFWCNLIMQGAGVVTVAGTATREAPNGVATATQYEKLQIRYRTTDTYNIQLL